MKQKKRRNRWRRHRKFYLPLAVFFFSFASFFALVPASLAMAESERFSEIEFVGDETETEEFRHLLFAKLSYDDLDQYVGESVKTYVEANPDLYGGEIWKDSGITYEAMYDSLVGDWEIYRVYNRNASSGFYGVAFKNGDQVIFAFRGSEMFTDHFAFDESNDWTGTDFRFALLNELSSQFDDADDCYRNLCKCLQNDGADNPKITFTGHSLGGALTACESLLTGVYGYSFDGAVGHVIDLILYYHFLEIDDFVGAEDMPFCNYTDCTGYAAADLIQHTNSENIYQIDRDTVLEDLTEYTVIPKYSTAGSHIIWSCLSHEGNRVFFNETYHTEETGYTYVPHTPVCMDIKRNIIEAGVENFQSYFLPESLTDPGAKYDFEALLGSLTGTVKNGRVMLASPEGGVLRGYDGIGVNSAFGVSVVMYGGKGDDELYGYTADDVLIGGTGDDILDGGLGNDVYVIDKNPKKTTTLRDEGGKTSAIILRNMNITRISQLSVNGEGEILIGGDGQKIKNEMSQDLSCIKCYSYQDGHVYELGELDEVTGEENDVTAETKPSDESWHLAMLEGEGSFFVFDENGNLIEEIRDYDSGESFRHMEREYGFAYVSEGEDASIFLVMKEEYRLQVSNRQKRVNLALAKYSDEQGIIASERKYGRKFEEYEISFDDSSLDDGAAGETTWEDAVNTGIDVLIGRFR